ncbi:SH3 domain-containing protein [Breznakiellaceae bacterium SP9]
MMNLLTSPINMRAANAQRLVPLVIVILYMVFFSASCQRSLGWGLLLWSQENPPVPSGTALQVYIRSNIDKVWVAGIPEQFLSPSPGENENIIDKFEIPLAQLELIGSQKNALERAAKFAEYARTYAETLQDGLPIRDQPDNTARRVYRLKLGEVIKILDKANGNPAVSTTGEPLPGSWYRVLTEDGNSGYCFSFRLRLFEHVGGPVTAVKEEKPEEVDTELERVLSLAWYPEVYGTMMSTRRLDLEQLSRHWGFYPGADTGTARILVADHDLTFSYSEIVKNGTRAWSFKGAQLQMTLQSDTVLAVTYSAQGSAMQTLLFINIERDIDDIIVQESARRDNLFGAIFRSGPEYTSNNYGTIRFREDGQFTWTGYNLLIPQVIPPTVLGSGNVDMRLFIGTALRERYNGAFTLIFEGVDGRDTPVNFLYSLDSEGFRMEYIPVDNIEGIVVNSRASSPLILYFFK